LYVFIIKKTAIELGQIVNSLRCRTTR